jgi:hypothetical protein
MKEILQTVFTSKETYRSNQLKFFKELDRRYKNVMHLKFTNLIERLEEEMKYLLASTVKFKTGKVEITSIQRYNSDTSKVYVQQVPAIHYKYSSGDEIKFFTEDSGLSDKDDLIRDIKDKKQTIMLGLSELRNFSSTIDQVRLDVFFKYLRELMVVKNRIYSKFKEPQAYGYGYEHFKDGVGTSSFILDGLFMSIDDERFDFSLVKRNDSKITLDENTNVNDCLDFAIRGYSRTNGPQYEKNLQIILGLMIKNYDKIIKILDDVESEKIKLLSITDTFIAGIKQYTIPFKVMKKLKN